VALVLLVACANLANLLLARSVDRRREMAVRAALGAGVGNLMAQALTEVAVLGLAGAAVGLGFAWIGTELILNFTPSDLPRRATVGLNGVVLAYAMVVALIAGVGSGLYPAWRSGRADSRGALRGALVAGGNRSTSLGTGLSKLRAGLVVGQLALAVLLVAGSGLLLRTLVEVSAVDPGAKTKNVLSVPFYLSGSNYGGAEINRNTQLAIREAVAALPGVESAVLAYDSPVETMWYESFTVVGRPPPDPGQMPVSRFRPVGVGYFEALEIPILGGRGFEATDRIGAPGAVVVNRALVERYFPGEEALGRTIATGTPRANFPEAPAEWTIVGIAENVGFTGPRDVYLPALYVPLAQFPIGYLHVFATTSVEPSSLIASARNAVWAVDPDLPLPDVAPLSDAVKRLVARERFVAVLATAFAVVALVLAGAGVYGVMSYSVASRRGELGVRMAMGAAPRRVLTEVFGKALAFATVGLLIGITGAVLLGMGLSGFLFRVRPWDPTVMAGVLVTLLVVAGIAVWLPARRAAATDPISVLRSE
jgi:predicted permease